MKKTIYQIGIWSLMLLAFVACKEDDVVDGDPIASFGATVSAESFLTYDFTNASQNYVSSTWDFGDGSAVSTDENPTHTFPEAGSYDVTLTVKNGVDVEATKTETVVVEDPNAQLTLLAGQESKTWSLVRNETSMYLAASSAPDADIYWAGLTNNGERPCMYDDTFTFHRDGSYVYNDAGTFWAEYGLFNNNANCNTNNTEQSCFEAIAANMVNACGDDISAWLSGTHEYTFSPENGQLTLIGEGAWIGIPKLGTTGEVLTPGAEESISMEASVVDGGASGVDSLFIAFNYEGTFWSITYVSHADPAATQPEIVTEFVPEECAPLAAVSPTEISHTFASNEAAEWNLMQPAESAAGLELGVDDPTDAAATKVGKYIRNAGVDYQELQFKLEPANAINFENLVTITMDVYLPSTNDYSGGLTDNIFVGFGATTCPPNWWEDLHQYEEMAVAKDQWVTVTFQLNNPSSVAVPGNGATVYERNDMDMIYIAIGGGGHGVGAEFYMRNFSIQ
ncbi:PKD domain-containing protein [Marivirga sp.]|uniref:PKD domain-containing protein n=1 Tax=Marivirga sp. TaxID=2018662 RepID=UPI0025DA9842|nr:PKD domain-containing protein [Marivirga sp.]